jgi:hypothetical protein
VGAGTLAVMDEALRSHVGARTDFDAQEAVGCSVGVGGGWWMDEGGELRG